MLFVYILKCSDESYYTGITNDIDRRFSEHQAGFNTGCYTFKRRPIELVFVQDFMYYDMAIAFEKQIKGWSRKKKEALIEDNWDKIKELAICKNKTHYKNFNRQGFDFAQPDIHIEPNASNK